MVRKSASIENNESYYLSVGDVVRNQVDYIISNNHRPIIIAGNGPSLKSIDYSRVPKNAIVLRINNFYFEDKYYLGNHADIIYIAGNTNVVKDSVNTLLNSLMRGEYTSHIYMARTSNIFDINPDYLPMVDVKKAFASNKKIRDYLAWRHMPPGVLPTSGMLALLSAIAFGFKDIYLAGIDFYTGEDAYAYPIGINHAKLLGLTPGARGYVNKYHTYDVDFAALLFAKSLEGVSIKSICPGSFVSNHVELAAVVNKSPVTPAEKPDGYIRDFIPLPKQAAKPAPKTEQKIAPKEEVRRPTSTQIVPFDTSEARLREYGAVKRAFVKIGREILPPSIRTKGGKALRSAGIL